MTRSLFKNWKLKSIAVFSLAIAMALSVVALSVSNAFLFRPPVAQQPERLVTVYTVAANGNREAFSYPDYRYIREHSRSFSKVAALRYSVNKTDVTLSGRDELAMVNYVSDNYFDVMGIQPVLGRFFSGSSKDAPPSVVLTYSYWQRFGADTGIIGKTLLLNRQRMTIIGVAPQQFLSPVFAFRADIISNIDEPPVRGDNSQQDRADRNFLLLGRMQAGITRQQARAEVRTLWSQLAAAYPIVEKDRTVDLMGISILSPDSVETARIFAAILITAALLTLVVACANAANLLLALATERRQEALIKTALGATRMRLISEFLKETAVLCAAGGVVGYGIAWGVLAALSRFDVNLPVIGSLPIAADLHPGVLVGILTLALILLASIASGIAPALYASKPNLASALSGEIAIGGTRRGVIRKTVVVIQVAVCTLVVVGAGVCLRSLHNLRQVDPGFSERRLIIFYPESQDLSRAQGIAAHAELRRRVEQVNGVEAVSLVRSMPLGGLGGNDFDHEEIEFADRPASDKKTFVYSTVVDENYFTTLGIRLLSGRTFRASDLEKGPEVMVINRLMAQQFWPNQDAVGRTFRIAKDKRLVTIVGVVADGKYGDLDEAPLPFMYHALSQRYDSNIGLVARTRGDPRLWAEPIARAIRQFGMKLSIPPATMENWMNLTLYFPLLTLTGVAGLSIVAILLATIGLYGAISYSVSERRKELGIRIALGARPAQLLAMVARETLTVVSIGVAAGSALGIAATVIFRSQFYGIRTVEWLVLAPVAVAILGASLTIAYLAARRWIRMDPMEAVRHA